MHCNLCKTSHAGNIKRKVNLEVWNVWGSQCVWCIFILRCVFKVSSVLCGKGCGCALGSVGCCQGWNTAPQCIPHSNGFANAQNYILSITNYTHTQIQCKRATIKFSSRHPRLSTPNGLWTFGNAKIDWMNVETFSEASSFKYVGLFVWVCTIYWQSNVLRTSLTL